MSDTSRLLSRLLKRGAGLSDLPGASYRGLAVAKDTAAFSRFAELSDQIALDLYRVKHYADVFSRTGDELSRELAVVLTEDLMKAAHKSLKGEALDSVGLTLRAWRTALTEGADEAARAAAAARMADLALQRATAYFERRAAKESAQAFAESAVALAIHKALSKTELTAEASSLLLFLRSVPRTDLKAWADITSKLASFRKLSLKSTALLRRAAPGLSAEAFQIAFRKRFRQEASNLKGLLMETWFWRSHAWTSREYEFVKAALRRARQLGDARGKWSPILITEPLLTMRAGKPGLELYDGSIILARQFKEGENTIEGVLDLVVQIKAEKDISVIRQIAKDIRRELELGGLIELRTRDGKRVIRLLKAPDQADPLRIVVAPELPSASKLTALSAGVDLLAIPTLLDAQQLDDLAYFLIRAAVSGP